MSLSEEAEAQPKVSKSKSRKRLYFVIGFIIIIAAAFGTWSMFPREAEAVTLGIDYVKGEKMTYEIEVTAEMMGQEFSYKMTLMIEILDKENGTYTMRTTIGLMNQTQTTGTFSITTRVNETGHTVEFLDVPPEFQQTMSSFSFMPGNGFYFPMDKAKVGDSWQIPIDMQTEEFNFTGTINNKITETRRITVPAGTYDVFKLEFTSSEFNLEYEPPPELNMTETMEMDMTMKGYEYFEKGTCRVIEAKIEQTTSMSMMGQTVSVSMTFEMKLTQHTR